MSTPRSRYPCLTQCPTKWPPKCCATRSPRCCCAAPHSNTSPSDSTVWCSTMPQLRRWADCSPLLPNATRSLRSASCAARRAPTNYGTASPRCQWFPPPTRAGSRRCTRPPPADPYRSPLTPSAAPWLGAPCPGGPLIIYGSLAQEPIPLPAAAVLHSALAIRGLTINRWLTAVSAEQRTSDVASAVTITTGMPQHFDVAAVYPLDRITDAVRHVSQPGKAGTVVVKP